MPIFTVDAEKCTRDGICSSVCPAKIIKGAQGDLPAMRPGAEQACIACGHCVAFCPHGACNIDVLPEAERLPVRRDLLPSADAFAMLARSRRSTRQFAGRPVERETVEAILDVVRYAPSAKNRQPLRWIVLHSRERIRELGDMMAEWLLEDAASSAPMLAEGKRLAGAWRTGADPLFRGAPHLALAVADASWSWAATDAAIAATYFELAALTRKVGCCWAGYVLAALGRCAPMRSFLAIADNETAAAGQLFGYLTLRPTAIPPRNHPSVTWMS